METTLNQSYIFMATVYGGIITGIVYDVYRMLRRALKAGRAVTAIFDILFTVCTLAIVAGVLYAVNSGEIRAYTFLGFALGFLSYIVGISFFLKYIFTRLGSKAKKKQAEGTFEAKKKN
jgi:spore cortex biosynthesis protein YabQ